MLDLLQSRLRLTEDSRKTKLGCKFGLSMVESWTPDLSKVILINVCYSFSSYNCQSI